MYPVGATQSGKAPGQQYLLTGGLAVCWKCEAPMVGTKKQLHKKREKAYLICHPSTRRPNGEPAGSCCGVMLEETEQHVVDRLFEELDRPAFMAALAADDHAERREEITGQLRAVEGQRKELAALWAIPGELTTAEWRTARQGLDAQEHKLRGDLAEVPPPIAGIDISTARAAWPDMTLDERREFIRLFIERVTIKKATPGRNGFDKDRVEIGWISR